MKTVLPKMITTAAQAVKFLTDLHINGEAFHPEDDANQVVWGNDPPTPEERERLNDLMGQIYALGSVDPCAVLLELLPVPVEE